MIVDFEGRIVKVVRIARSFQHKKQVSQPKVVLKFSGNNRIALEKLGQEADSGTISRTQFPLIPATHMTVHKTQGLS